jgi:uncharacterized LabA/DUF88 family protein/cold shock CspA family protein
MATGREHRLTRIGVFYDGNYFLHVSNYYAYFHERKSRLSIAGLHHFIRNQIAQEEGTDERLCQIVDAHYFRGRLPASEAANQGNALYYERAFDDILSSEGVTTHYLPIRTSSYGARFEKGIDVWLALEAFEQSYYKRFDVLVLIASDGDYVPLIRKLNSLGTRVMVLSWDFEYTNDYGKTMTTRTSQELLEEVTYTVAMHEVIDNRVRRNEPLVNSLFVPRSAGRVFNKQRGTTEGYQPGNSIDATQVEDGESPYHDSGNGRKVSAIKALNKGFGFILGPLKDIFFYHGNLIDYDFNDLVVGDRVEFREETLEDGRLVAQDVVVIE